MRCDRVLVGDGKFAHRRDGRGRAPKSGKEKALEGVPIVCFDDEEEDVLGIGAISPDHFDALGSGVKEGVGTPLVDGAGLGRVSLCNVKEHCSLLDRV
jgi:hypothetical protein